jgi:hypothetical protein
MPPDSAGARGGAAAGDDDPGGLDGLRILEIGDVAMFKQGAPARTELVWTGHLAEVDGVGRPAPFTLGRLPALRRALDRGDFDLVVGHPPRQAPWHPARVGALLRRFGRRGPALALRGLGILLLRRATRTPLCMVDLADAVVIGRHNFPLLERARVYFKRELPPNRWKVFAGSAAAELPSRQRRLSPRLAGWCAKLAPISLAVSPLRRAEIAAATSPPPEKTVDVFFAGQVATSSTARAEGLAELRALAAGGVVVDLALERLPRPEFYRRCARAWLTWSPEGLGWDCFRHYEAPLCGSVPLMNQPTIVRHAPLRAGEHALYYDPEPGALARSVRQALGDRARLATLAGAARAHVERHHTLERLCAHVARAGVLGARGLATAPGGGHGPA